MSQPFISSAAAFFFVVYNIIPFLAVISITQRTQPKQNLIQGCGCVDVLANRSFLFRARQKLHSRICHPGFPTDVSGSRCSSARPLRVDVPPQAIEQRPHAFSQSPLSRASRPLMGSLLKGGNGSILLKNSQIEQLRKYRFRTHNVV